MAAPKPQRPTPTLPTEEHRTPSASAAPSAEKAASAARGKSQVDDTIRHNLGNKPVK